MKFFVILMLCLIVACSKKEEAPTSVQVTDGPKKEEAARAATTNLEALVVQHKLYQYPEITVLLAVHDAQKTADKVRVGGGRILYDPNLGDGTDIRFLVVTLPPEKVTDKKFIESLDLRAVALDIPKVHGTPERQRPSFDNPLEDEMPDSGAAALPVPSFSQVYVPLKEIGAEELRQKHKEKALGKDIVVAVVDSGIESAHPAFEDRVVYWNDLTQETDTAITPVEIKEGKVTLPNGNTVTLPASIDATKPVGVAVIVEANLAAQLDEAEKRKKQVGLDVNENGTVDDTFYAIIAEDKASGEKAVWFDTNANGEFEPGEWTKPVGDFNRLNQSQEKKVGKYVQFPSRNRVKGLPVLIKTDEKGGPTKIALGLVSGGHGTHVAGIIAGKTRQWEGVAPQAKLMSLKVCSGITCTDAAILRGFIDAFYNPQGIVPDVVNVSLGSLQVYNEGLYRELFRDLSAKFGTVIILSGSNSGPGHRTMNSLGAGSPAIQVGAHQSRDIRSQQYSLPDGDLFSPENGMHFFSSVGPSITGELRPNIVAPGSAISSTPRAEGGVAMYNGTSMASPIVAGGVAAILGIAKTDEKFKNIIKAQEQKHLEVRNKKPSRYSLSDLSLLVRETLEDTATYLPDLSAVQQGHGLVNVSAALDELLDRASKLNIEESKAFAEIKLEGTYYNRSADVAPVATFGLGVDADGEVADAQRLELQGDFYWVKMDRLEEYDAQGRVQLADTEIIRLSLPGSVKNEKALRLVPSSNRRLDFLSVHARDKMEPGKTYLAKYGIYNSKGYRATTIVDVVHKPYEFSSEMHLIRQPALGPDNRDMGRVLSFSSKNLGANRVHRYLIAARPQDAWIQADLALTSNSAGGFHLIVNDPDGKVVFQGRGQNFDHIASNGGKVSFSFPIKNKPGIYEITLANSTGIHSPRLAYDLQVQSIGLRSSVEAAELAVGNSPVAKDKGSVTVVVAKIPDEGGGLVNFNLKEGARGLLVKDIPLRSGAWTFQRLPIPHLGDGAGPEKTDVVIQSPPGVKLPVFIGRLDHRLYRLKNVENKEFEPVVTSTEISKGFLQQSFSNVPRPKNNSLEEALYFAVETISAIPEPNTIKAALEKVTLEAIFGSLTVPVQSVGLKTLHFDPASAIVPLEIAAPDSIEKLVPGMKTGFVRTELQITVPGRSLRLDVPVTIYP